MNGKKQVQLVKWIVNFYELIHISRGVSYIFWTMNEGYCMYDQKLEND